MLLQAAAGQAIDISWGQKRTNGLQKQVSPGERPSPIFLTAIIFQTMQLGKRRKSQGKVWELAVSSTLITKIQIRIPQRRGMLDQDRLSSPREVTKEGEQRPFKSLWKTALWLRAWSEHVQKCFKTLISRKSGTTKFPLLLYDSNASWFFFLESADRLHKKKTQTQNNPKNHPKHKQTKNTKQTKTKVKPKHQIQTFIHCSLQQKPYQLRTFENIILGCFFFSFPQPTCLFAGSL